MPPKKRKNDTNQAANNKQKKANKSDKKRTLNDVFPEPQLAAFAATLECIHGEYQRDFLLHGHLKGQMFTKQIANSSMTKLLTTWFGKLEDLTDEQRERLWEKLPGLVVNSKGVVDISVDSDFEGTHSDIKNNYLSAYNSIKLLAYLSYVGHACPHNVTLKLLDPCNTKLRLAAQGKGPNGIKLSLEKKAIAKASLMLADRRNALHMILTLLLDPLFKTKLTEDGKRSAAAAIKLAPLLHNNTNDTSAAVYGRIREIIKDHPSLNETDKERLTADWTPLELGSNKPVADNSLKILPRSCCCRQVSQSSAFPCQEATDMEEKIGELADALVCVPGLGETWELKEEGLEWRGSMPSIAHDNKNAVRIGFLLLFRGHHEMQADGSEKVVGGNCSVELSKLNIFLDAFDKAKSTQNELLFLYKNVLDILVEGFHPCSFTVHTAEEGVLRILAENVCGEWPFDSEEPASFNCFEKARQEQCRTAHIKYWDDEWWGEWYVEERAYREA